MSIPPLNFNFRLDQDARLLELTVRGSPASDYGGGFQKWPLQSAVVTL